MFSSCAFITCWLLSFCLPEYKPKHLPDTHAVFPSCLKSSFLLHDASLLHIGKSLACMQDFAKGQQLMTANPVIVPNESKGKQTAVRAWKHVVTSDITKSEIAGRHFETLIFPKYTLWALCIIPQCVSPKFTNRASDYDALSYLLYVDTHWLLWTITDSNHVCMCSKLDLLTVGKVIDQLSDVHQGGWLSPWKRCVRIWVCKYMFAWFTHEPALSVRVWAKGGGSCVCVHSWRMVWFAWAQKRL